MVLVVKDRHQAPIGGKLAGTSSEHQQQLTKQLVCCCCCCSSSSSATAANHRHQSRATSLVALSKISQPNNSSKLIQPIKTSKLAPGAINKRRLLLQQQQQHKVAVNNRKPTTVDCPAVDCAKCQLLVRWTSAQALLTSAGCAIGDDNQQLVESSSYNIISKPVIKTATEGQRKQQQQQQLYRANRRVRGQLFECKEIGGCAVDDNHQGVCNLQRKQQQVSRQLRKQLGKPPKPPLKHPKEQQEKGDELEISSLTESSLNGDSKQEGSEEQRPKLHNNDDDDDEDDKWSLSSCYAKTRARKVVGAAALLANTKPIVVAHSNHQRKPSIRARVRNLAPQNRHKTRRPAPLPPAISGRHLRKRQHHLLQQSRNQQRSGTRCDNSQADSGNTSGTDTSRLSASEQVLVNQQMAPSSSTQIVAANKKRAATHHHSGVVVDTTNSSNNKVTTTSTSTANGAAATATAKTNLLSESEVYSIEHFLRSHKSSIYVCGCMANLYLTSTQLVDNGRCSKPAADGWQLSQTGVPVLTFDSGLTRNRDRRRLSINLAERGSGFVLWSDIIDHLSNYRAFCTRLHGQQQQQTDSSKQTTTNEQVCDTFHVMYLSTNHRIMVGLSFDDATCAKFFLKQVELVTSDPANIALTGPKLAHRIASVGRLGRLLTGAGTGAAAGRSRRKSTSDSKSSKGAESNNTSDWSSCSVDSVETSRAVAANQQQQQQVKQIDALGRTITGPLITTDRRAEKARQWRLSRLIAASRRADQTSVGGGSGAAGSDYSWSTLKRAIRFGGQQSRAAAAAAARRVSLEHQSSEGNEEQDPQTNNPAFRPKPLAALAAAGKVYRPGKRMPRKCDISAPCLFQHVTSIDLSNLEGLHSRALVVAGGDPPKSLSTGTEMNSSSSVESEESTNVGQITTSIPETRQPDRYRRKLSLISQQTSSSGAVTFSNSGSSCYSSASISPANSECGANNRVARMPRPQPPQVPQRSSSTELKSVAKCANARCQQVTSGAVAAQLTQQPLALNSSNKIQAIIRELQAQTSAELIDAKRKLMADIADQVVARGAAAELSARAHRKVQQSSGESGHLRSLSVAGGCGGGSQSSFSSSSCAVSSTSSSSSLEDSVVVGGNGCVASSAQQQQQQQQQQAISRL